MTHWNCKLTFLQKVQAGINKWVNDNIIELFSLVMEMPSGINMRVCDKKWVLLGIDVRVSIAI